MASDRRGTSPRKQPRQVRAELTRERILDAAAHVFGEYGYAAGTTNRIAEQARVSIGSLYQYYPNKDAILLELVTRHLDSGRDFVERRLEQGLPDSLEGVLRLSVRAAIDNHLDDPRLLRVMMEQAPRSPELLAKVKTYEKEHLDHVRELLRRRPEVRVADTEVAGRLVVATIELVVHKVVADPGSVDLERFENELVAMLTRYLTGG
ncbi:TetR/AcrR family transcriptional regulator [Streptomyces ziwulingensis]|uniref:TetR/AcrR family transcriptional regulator n=1 Tax=Streptomyces ziwulingensis TaxID=1045501 RepID=A0ABP9BSE8_9ACTN